MERDIGGQGESSESMPEVTTRHILQATLLLPTEAHPTNEVITTEFIKDHLAFWDSNHRSAPFVTLSGLRGTMAEYVNLQPYVLASSPLPLSL